LLVQWLLLLPRHESRGRVAAWRGQEGLRAVLSHGYQTGVYGEVPLPRVHVCQPWSTLTVVGGGVVGSRSGVTGGVATTVSTGVVIPAASIAVTAVVFVPVVVAVVAIAGATAAGLARRARRQGRRQRSRRRVVGVEHHRSSS
jgi:hypothetical protein